MARNSNNKRGHKPNFTKGRETRDFVPTAAKVKRDTLPYHLGGIADPFKLVDGVSRPVLVTSSYGLTVQKGPQGYAISLSGIYFTRGKFAFFEDPDWILKGANRPIPCIGIVSISGSGKSKLCDSLSRSAKETPLHLDAHGHFQNGKFVPNYLPPIKGRIFDTAWTDLQFPNDGVIIFTLPSYDLFIDINRVKANEVGIDHPNFNLYSGYAQSTFISYVGLMRSWFKKVAHIANCRIIVVPVFKQGTVTRGWYEDSASNAKVEGGNNG